MTPTDQVSDPGYPEYAPSTAKSVNAPGFAVSTQVDAKEFADSIIATIPIPLLVLETDLRVRTASHTFYETFRVMPEETEGQLIYQLGNGQWDIPDLRTLLEKILPNDQFFTNYEVEHTFDGIGRCTMLLNGRRLDHIQLILLVITDITKRKQIEVELLESHKGMEATLTQLRDVQAQLVQQERLAAMGGLAAGIAHDFNNILSIILLHTELSLRAPQLLPKLHMQLSTIQQQAKRAAHLIQQILDFGRHTVLQPHPLNLVLFLNEQVELLRRTLSDNIKVGLIDNSSKSRTILAFCRLAGCVNFNCVVY